MDPTTQHSGGPVQDPPDLIPIEKAFGERNGKQKLRLYPDEKLTQRILSQKHKTVEEMQAAPHISEYERDNFVPVAQQLAIMDMQRAALLKEQQRVKSQELNRARAVLVKSITNIKEDSNGHFFCGQIETEIDAFELELHEVVCCTNRLVQDHRPTVTREEFSRIVDGYKELLNKPTASTSTTHPPYLFTATLSPSLTKQPYIFTPASASPRIIPLKAAPPIPWETKPPTPPTTSLFARRTTFTSPRTRPLNDRPHGTQFSSSKPLLLPTPSAKLRERKWEKINQRDRERQLSEGRDWAQSGDQAEECTDDQDQEWVQVNLDVPLGGAYTLL